MEGVGTAGELPRERYVDKGFFTDGNREEGERDGGKVEGVGRKEDREWRRRSGVGGEGYGHMNMILSEGSYRFPSRCASVPACIRRPTPTARNSGAGPPFVYRSLGLQVSALTGGQPLTSS